MTCLHRGGGKIIVIGAGLGGLAAARSLMRAGLEVALYEQAGSLESLRVGWGMAIWPNGMRALERLGLADAVRESAAELDRIDFYSDTGERLNTWKVGELARQVGAPTVGASRAVLHQLLGESLEKGTLNLGARCVGFDDGAGEVLARFEDGREARGDALVGADGLRSVLRSELGRTREGFPPYAGYTLWHAQTPFPPGRVDPEAFSLLFGRGSRFAYFYVDDERLYWSGIAYVNAGGKDPADGPKPPLLDRFGGYAAPVREIVAGTPESAIHRGDIFGGEPLDAWGRGRITLLGDAAHPMTTILGQGACMALEDAVALADAVESHGVVEGLHEYERQRRERTTRMMALVRRLNSSASREGPVACWLRKQAIRFLFTRGIGRRYEELIKAEP
jgi:2-polyprenyl-6-methoxyphenol hydroxylase-like FAD-dependent oxidoreductase